MESVAYSILSSIVRLFPYEQSGARGIWKRDCAGGTFVLFCTVFHEQIKGEYLHGRSEGKVSGIQGPVILISTYTFLVHQCRQFPLIFFPPPTAHPNTFTTHQMHALMCAEASMMTSSRPSRTLEGPSGELLSHSSMKSGIFSNRSSRTRRTSRSARMSFVDLRSGMKQRNYISAVVGIVAGNATRS